MVDVHSSQRLQTIEKHVREAEQSIDRLEPNGPAIKSLNLSRLRLAVRARLVQDSDCHKEPGIRPCETVERGKKEDTQAP